MMGTPTIDEIKEYFLIRDFPKLKNKNISFTSFSISLYETDYRVWFMMTKINPKSLSYESGVTSFKYGEVELYFRKKKLDKIKNNLHKDTEKSNLWKKMKKLFV